MVLKNRSRVEILYDIVSAAKPYSKKTHLMYRGNLSYQQLDLYMEFILRNGLLEERYVDDEGRLYLITKKGEEFVKLFEDMRDLVKPKSVKEEVIVPQQQSTTAAAPSSSSLNKVNPPSRPSFSY